MQAVQDMNNTVPLVAGRSILVRGYAYYPQNNTGNRFSPSARLRVLKNGSLIGQLYAPSGTIVDAVRAPETLRATLNRSFNFDVPAAWTTQAGTGLLQFEFTVNPTLSTPENGAAETGNQPLLNNTTFVYANIVAGADADADVQNREGNHDLFAILRLESGCAPPRTSWTRSEGQNHFCPSRTSMSGSAPDCCSGGKRRLPEFPSTPFMISLVRSTRRRPLQTWVQLRVRAATRKMKPSGSA